MDNHILAQIKQEDQQASIDYHYLHLSPSGFRDYGQFIPRAAYRVGINIGSKIASSPEPSFYVIMVTASHNTKQYNGIKFSDNLGLAMNDQDALIAERFVNDSGEGWLQSCQLNKQGNKASRVFLGMDKRQSSPKLYGLVNRALSHFNVHVLEFGQVTTPTLFSYCHCYLNQTNEICPGMEASQIQKTYVAQAISKFREAAAIVGWESKPNVVLDCANGAVGYQIANYADLLHQFFDVDIINTEHFDSPNQKCGSDYVSNTLLLPIDKYVSFDGDGDRIVFYFKASQQEPLVLHDGDRLHSLFIMGQVILEHKLQGVKIGCACTVVSNRGLLKYFQKLGIPAQIGAVGIKYLYQQIQKYDIGVCFQNSGHGSLYVDQRFYQTLRSVEPKTQQLRLLLCLLDLSNNNAKGDGFKNFLVSELCQQYLGLSNSQLKLYQQSVFATKNIKISRSDLLQTDIKTGAILSPQSFSSKFGLLCSLHPDMCIITRKSGTEIGVVRVRVQSSTSSRESVQKALEQMCQLLIADQQLNGG